MRGDDSAGRGRFETEPNLFPTCVGMTLMKAKKNTFAFNFPTQVGIFSFEVIFTDDRNAVMT